MPIIRNACDFGDDAAAQSVIVYGTIIGRMLMPSPDSTSRKAPARAETAPPRAPICSERSSQTNNASVITGTGESSSRFGQANQRCWICGWISGVHMLTIAMNAATPKVSSLALPRAQFCSSPSVFITSQQAPIRP